MSPVRRPTVRALAVSLVAAAIATVGAAASASDAAPEVNALFSVAAALPSAGQASSLPRWITGCWAGTVGTSRVHERWSAVDGATLIGVSHTLADGRLTGFEFLRIEVRPDALVYVAQPGGRPPTEFRASSVADSAIVFENPAHDFPKRIGYERSGLTGLAAWIDGGPGAVGKRTEYTMTRVACEP